MFEVKIPERWELKRMKYSFNEISIKGYPNEPLLVASQNMGVVPKEIYGQRTVEATKDLHLLKLVEVGNFVISLRSFQGGIEYAYYRGIISPAYTILKSNGTYYEHYFRYLAKSVPFIEMLKTCVTGIREGQNIDYSVLKKKFLPVPPLDEQEKIVRYLDKKTSDMTKFIDAKKKQVELLKELKRSIISDAVTNGLYRNSAADWKKLRLKSLFSFGKGLLITKENLVEKGVPVISYGQVHSKNNFGTGIKSDLIKFVSEKYLETNPKSLVNAGDFIFADTSEDLAGCGNCVYVDKQMFLFAGYHTIILRSREESNKKFLAYLFQSDNWRYQIRSKVSGVKVFSITKSILGQTYVILPSLWEQKEIADYLDVECAKIENLIEAIQKEISLVEELRKSLISEVVTGKIDVRELI